MHAKTLSPGQTQHGNGTILGTCFPRGQPITVTLSFLITRLITVNKPSECPKNNTIK